MNPRIFIGILAVIAVISIIVGIFGFGSGSDPTTVEEAVDITTFAETSSSVVYEKAGKIVAPENHYEVRISVTKSDRIIKVLKGYDGNVVKSRRYNNTINSYDEFLFALNSVGFLESKSNIDPADFIKKGSCPSGSRYTYRAQRLATILKETWATTCSSGDGTNAGDRNSIKKLFEAQIPDYRDITSGYSF